MASKNFDFSLSQFDYITVSPLSNNDQNRDKVSEIIVTNGSVTRTVVLTQYGIPAIIPSDGSDFVDVPITGKTINCQVYSHYEVSFNGMLSWLHILVNGYEVDDVQQFTFDDTYTDIQIVVDANTGNSRTAILNLIYYRDGVDEGYTSIQIEQNGSATSTISNGSVYSNNTGSIVVAIPASSSTYTYYVDVTSNTSWRATTNYTYIGQLSGWAGNAGTTRLYFYVLNNTTGSPRTATITFKTNDNLASSTLTLHQLG